MANSITDNALKFLDQMDELVYILDADLKIVRVNRAASHFFDLPAEDLVGKSCYKYCQFRKLNTVNECPTFIAKETGTTVTKESSLFKEQTWLTKVYPIKNDEEIIGFVEIKEDITERKKLEFELALSEHRYQELVETSNEWFWEIDENYNYTFVSQKASDFLGYQKEDIIGKSYCDFCSPQEKKRLEVFCKDYFRNSQAFSNLERRMIHADGFEVWLSSSGSPIHNISGKIIGFRGVDRDITSNKKAADMQRLAYTQIERNIQEFARLVDGIKNPLSVILGLIELNMEDSKDRIISQIETIISITNQISVRWLESEQFRKILQEYLLKV